MSVNSAYEQHPEWAYRYHADAKSRVLALQQHFRPVRRGCINWKTVVGSVAEQTAVLKNAAIARPFNAPPSGT